MVRAEGNVARRRCVRQNAYETVDGKMIFVRWKRSWFRPKPVHRRCTSYLAIANYEDVCGVPSSSHRELAEVFRRKMAAALPLVMMAATVFRCTKLFLFNSRRYRVIDVTSKNGSRTHDRTRVICIVRPPSGAAFYGSINKMFERVSRAASKNLQSKKRTRWAFFLRDFNDDGSAR